MRVAGRVGVQDSPPGSALESLSARVSGMTQHGLLDEHVKKRSLIRAWSLRGAPFFFPVGDHHVFTLGALPPSDEGLTQLLLGSRSELERLGLTMSALVDMLARKIGDVLGGRALPIGELGAVLAPEISGELTTAQRRIWAEEGPWSAGQSVGEGLVHFGVRGLSLRGLICFAGQDEGTSPFVLTREWLPDATPMPGGRDAAAARAELLSRALSAYGAVSPADFAAWLGIRVGDATPWWDDLIDTGAELVDVTLPDGRRARALAGSLEGLRSAPPSEGVRLLPARDPYTQFGPKSLIVGREHHQSVWRAVGSPGTVLVDGEIRGTWRARRAGDNGGTLAVEVELFRGNSLGSRERGRLEAEGESLSSLRGVSRADVVIASG